MKHMTFDEMASEYCERQQSTPTQLRENLVERVTKFHPTGFMLLQCQQMDSYMLGSLVVLPYGPNNTYKEIPTHPVSPRGLASDMSMAIGYILADEI